MARLELPALTMPSVGALGTRNAALVLIHANNKALALACWIIIFATTYILDDAYGMPLFKQIQAGVENQHLECSNPDHLLVVSPGLRFACMTAETAQKAGWPEPAFTEDNDIMINLVLKINVDGEMYGINSTLTNGFAQCPIWSC